MPTYNTLDVLHPSLAAVYSEAKAAYRLAHPNGPFRPRLGETYRPANVQAAYYAQGRQPLAEINRLRGVAGLAAIGTAEAGRIITKAQPGQSPHGFNPSRAFDVQMVQANGEPTWDEIHYRAFAAFVKVAAEKLKVAVSIGAYWPKFVDMPHTELASWRKM